MKHWPTKKSTQSPHPTKFPCNPGQAEAWWRGLFWVLAACLLLAMALIRWWVPADPPAALPSTPGSAVAAASAAAPAAQLGAAPQGYRDVFLHPVFIRSAPIGFFTYGGMIAVQALWAGPWLTRVAGQTAGVAAQGLFNVYLALLSTFLALGCVILPLVPLGWTAPALITWGLPPAPGICAFQHPLVASAGALVR